MPDVFKLFAKTFLVISVVTFLASALMSGNLNPTSWDGHSFESTLLNVAAWMLALAAAGLFLIYSIAERIFEEIEKDKRKEMRSYLKQKDLRFERRLR